MCKRYSQQKDMHVLAALWRARAEGLWQGSYNIAPGQTVPVLTEHRGVRNLRLMEWGGDVAPTTHAENLVADGAAETLLTLTRCVLPATGFYAWVDDIRQPWYFEPPRDMLAMAGLCRRQRRADGRTVESVSLITTLGNATVLPIANRMPVLLAPEDLGLWFADATPATVWKKLLRPTPEEALTVRMVSTHVNTPGNDGPACISAREQRRP